LYQAENGLTFCLPCLTGKFQNEIGKPSCKECPAGYSNGGTKAKECAKCGRGRFGEQRGQADCKVCLVGYYSEEVGLVSRNECTECPAGKYSPTPGAKLRSSCTDCQLGKYGTEEGQASSETGCSDCAVDQFRPSKEVVNGIDTPTDPTMCVDCPAGEYQNDKGQASW